MKNSNSRDKNIKTQATLPANKLFKTDIQQPSKYEQMDRTNYNRPASGKKLQSAKNLPPKAPGAKKQYVVQDNMTQSRITQAKQGLQLLKKKMSAKGLSREKVVVTEQQKPISSFKKVQSKNQDTQLYENRNSNMPPKKIDKKYQQEPIQSKPPTSTKQISSKTLNQTKQTPQNERKQPPPPAYQQYRDQQMEVPIKPKKDFNALLEQQLRKQKQGKLSTVQTNNTKKNSYSNQINEYPPQNMEMIQCRHCERKFGEAAIEKHQKICLKVFQTKRKAFDAAAQRAPQVQGIQQVQMQSKKVESAKVAPKKQQTQPAKKQQKAMPKWKAQSLAFRANLKAAKGIAQTAQQKEAAEVAQGLVQCNHCGRKFNEKAAQRHIPFCETKSKQISKTNAPRKK